MERNENASTELLMSWMQSGGVISGGAMPSHADNKGLSAAAGSLQFLCPGQTSPSHGDNKGLSAAAGSLNVECPGHYSEDDMPSYADNKGLGVTYTPYC